MTIEESAAKPEAIITPEYKDGKLKAEKTVNNPAPKLGEEVEYRITFRNVVEHGKVAKVKIKDELPTGLEFVEGSERAEGESETVVCESEKRNRPCGISRNYGYERKKYRL